MEKKKIVVTDDDLYILKVIERIFSEDPYDIFTTQNPLDALKFLKDHEVDLIISDYHMGVMTGFEFFARCNDLDSKAPRILITGTPDASLEVDKLSSLNIRRVVLKPWETATFQKIIRDILA